MNKKECFYCMTTVSSVRDIQSNEIVIQSPMKQKSSGGGGDKWTNHRQNPFFFFLPTSLFPFFTFSLSLSLSLLLAWIMILPQHNDATLNDKDNIF